MDRSRLGIVIPAFNEENTIGTLVRECRNYGVPIVVDDGSSDRTSAVSHSEGADVVIHEINRGYDAALNSGFDRAANLGCEFVVTIDADGQHESELISRYIEWLDRGADVVIGIRDKRQRLAEHCFAFLAGLFFGVADPLCGLKGYRMSVYHALGHFDSYGSVGTELTLFAVRSGFRIKQLPIMVLERNGVPRFGRKPYANYRIFRAMFLSLIRIRPVKREEELRGH